MTSIDAQWRDRLREAVKNRAASAYTKESAIAARAGIQPETLSRVLNRPRSRPSFETVVRIARAAHEHVGYLIGERALSSYDEASLLTALRVLRDAIDGALRVLASTSARTHYHHLTIVMDQISTLSDDWRRRLRAAIDRTGKKHSFIAAEAGVNPTTLSRILNGRTQPAFEKIVRITHAAGETIGWLLGEHGYCFSAEERAQLRAAAATIIQTTT